MHWPRRACRFLPMAVGLLAGSLSQSSSSLGRREGRSQPLAVGLFAGSLSQSSSSWDRRECRFQPLADCIISDSLSHTSSHLGCCQDGCHSHVPSTGAATSILGSTFGFRQAWYARNASPSGRHFSASSCFTLPFGPWPFLGFVVRTGGGRGCLLHVDALAEDLVETAPVSLLSCHDLGSSLAQSSQSSVAHGGLWLGLRTTLERPLALDLAAVIFISWAGPGRLGDPCRAFFPLVSAGGRGNSRCWRLRSLLAAGAGPVGGRGMLL